jgi:solute carrier family 32 (vesicular inhibitory amino acid transporter)
VSVENLLLLLLYNHFAAILALYLPVAIAGYAVYGESVAPNVASSLTLTPLTLAGNILMALHLVTAFIILINPVCQEMEELYNIPRGKRTTTPFYFLT